MKSNAFVFSILGALSLILGIASAQTTDPRNPPYIIAQTGGNYSYLGCWYDQNSGGRVLTGSYSDLGGYYNTSRESCVYYCAGLGFSWSGTEFVSGSHRNRYNSTLLTQCSDTNASVVTKSQMVTKFLTTQLVSCRALETVLNVVVVMATLPFFPQPTTRQH